MYQSASTTLYCTIFIVFIKIIKLSFLIFIESIAKSNYFYIFLFIKFFIKNRLINSSIILLFDQKKQLKLFLQLVKLF